MALLVFGAAHPAGPPAAYFLFRQKVCKDRSKGFPLCNPPDGRFSLRRRSPPRTAPTAYFPPESSCTHLGGPTGVSGWGCPPSRRRRKVRIPSFLLWLCKPSHRVASPPQERTDKRCSSATERTPSRSGSWVEPRSYSHFLEKSELRKHLLGPLDGQKRNERAGVHQGARPLGPLFPPFLAEQKWGPRRESAWRAAPKAQKTQGVVGTPKKIISPASPSAGGFGDAPPNSPPPPPAGTGPGTAVPPPAAPGKGPSDPPLGSSPAERSCG